MNEKIRTWLPGEHAYIGRRYAGGGRYVVDEDTNRAVTILRHIGDNNYKVIFEHWSQLPSASEWDVIVHADRLFTKPVGEYLLDK